MKFNFSITYLLLLLFLSPFLLDAQSKTDICDYQDFVDAASPNTAEMEARKDRYLKLIGVLQELGNYRQDFIAEGNLINLFPTAYYHTTHSEMLEIISNEFTYPVEKMQQMLAFYDAYKENRSNYDTGNNSVEAHWKTHFDQATSYKSNKVNFICLGIKATLETGIDAHVNYDLARAIRYANKNKFDPNASISILKKEFDSTNKFFPQTRKKTLKDLSLIHI